LAAIYFKGNTNKSIPMRPEIAWFDRLSLGLSTAFMGANLWEGALGNAICL
jgi:hypothetical protein